MALIVKDRVKESTTTTGTADFTLDGASFGFQTFAVIGNTNTTYYAAVDQVTGAWEVGVGTYSSTGPTLTRDTVLESSNAGSKVVFAAGSKDVFCTYPAERSVYLDSAGSAVTLLDIGTLGTSTANITTANITAGTVTTTPTSGNDLVNKTYVDTLAASGIHFHQPVRVESPINLIATYNNGTAGVGATLTNSGTQAALVIDGVTVSVADRVLIYQQTTQTQNGIYVVTNVGSGSTNWILTRASDANTYVINSANGLSEGSTVFVQQGATGAGETYTCNTAGVITFGTTNISFAQISSAQIYSAGTGLTLSGTQFSITPVGTAGTYGSAASVPVLAINASGQITTATPTAIAIAAAAVSGLAASATTDTTNAANITTGTLPSARLNGSYTGVTGVGTLAAGTWNANTIAAIYGGTGLTSYVQGDLLYATSSTTVGRLADAVAGNALISGGVGGDPAWGKIGLDTHVSGTLLVANGGTGATTLTGYVYGNGAGAMTASTSIPNSATTATSANTASAIVARDGSGNFSAGTITASLNGNASTATTAANVNNGTLSMAVSGTGLSGSATFTANQSGNSTFTVTSNATNANTGSTIVARDASGNFSAGTITAALSGNATTSSSTSGNAATATTLQTARNIGGVSFNGSADINLPGVNTAGNQNTSGTAANVTGTVAVANGGTGATSAAAARTNLGATTLGGNLFTLANVAAISFPRFNADNTVSSLDAASFRTAIGAGTSSTTGTVTSVSGTGTASGLSLSGTVTTSGSLTLSGTVNSLAAGTYAISISGNAATVTNGVYTNNNQQISGIKQFNTANSGMASASGSLSALEAYGTGGGAFMTFHRPGLYAAYFGLDSDNVWKVGGWSTGAVAYPILHSNNYTSYAPTLTGSGASGTWGISVTGNAATATALSSGQTNWSGTGVLGNVVGLMAWKHYGNSHVIFDASNSTSPNGGAINNTNAQNAWTGTFPTLMGWNGSNTYGVRVDSARVADSAPANGGNSSTVGGFTPSASSGVVNRVVVADGSGYIFNNYFNSTDNSVASGVSAVMVKAGDNYYRSGTAAAIATFISGQTMNIAGSAASLSANLPVSRLNSGTGASSSTFWRGDGVWATAGGGSPGGSNTQVQYNSSGSFAGSANLTFNGTNLTCGGTVTANSDESLKSNWRDFPAEFVDQLAKVKHGTYDRVDIELTQDGVSAQSLQSLLPFSVLKGEDGKLSVAYGNAALVSAIELAKRVIEQDARIARLEALVAQLTKGTAS